MITKLKRLFFTNYKVLKKVLATKPNPNKPIRIWSRASMIIPQYVGYTFEIHNGKAFTKLTVSELHVFKRFGEFSQTRKRREKK